MCTNTKVTMTSVYQNPNFFLTTYALKSQIKPRLSKTSYLHPSGTCREIRKKSRVCTKNSGKKPSRIDRCIERNIEARAICQISQERCTHPSVIYKEKATHTSMRNRSKTIARATPTADGRPWLVEHCLKFELPHNATIRKVIWLIASKTGQFDLFQDAILLLYRIAADNLLFSCLSFSLGEM